MLTAVIRENECIGCHRCVPVCPVDAIIGSNKLMHAVLTDDCIGCKLCLKPCPVDCIEIKFLESVIQNDISKPARVQRAKKRYHAKLKREQKRQIPMLLSYNISEAEKKAQIKDYIQSAIKRTRQD